VHWLTDVIAGVIVGWTWFFVVSLIFGGRLQRFGHPAVEVAEQTGVAPDAPAVPHRPQQGSATSHEQEINA
jgi:undecaprenyl-diphosphatase